MNHLKQFREMMSRATENPYTSRYYGMPSKPAGQRAVYIECAAMALESSFQERAWMHTTCGVPCCPSYSAYQERALIARRVFYSAAIRETLARSRILPR